MKIKETARHLKKNSSSFKERERNGMFGRRGTLLGIKAVVADYLLKFDFNHSI
jgi:hypothetical protein